ncbi:hypothetical protein GLOIN_2v1837969 [Rhizophagus clarus]|uniref:Uncharacterized protein n=1 Tax=Rhizophagus clarus TaxID=94130 RepID=A0A8H3QNP1_9GLOM|nr:hypothetical protein GLOIN_2v1837969 [Rhizophagus clarus]
MIYIFWQKDLTEPRNFSGSSSRSLKETFYAPAKMVSYGYVAGISIGTNPFTPHKLDRIKLTPLKPKFVVIGTRDSIFDWMKCHEDLTLQHDDEEQQQIEPNHGHSRKKIINMIKPLFSSGTKNGTKKYNGSSKMRLEISVYDFKKRISTQDQAHHHQSTPIMKSEIVRGARLLHVLNEWQEKLNLEQIKKSYDYEL